MKKNSLGNCSHLPNWRAADWAVVIFGGVLMAGAVLGVAIAILALERWAVR